jgi:hypothetical protein
MAPRHNDCREEPRTAWPIRKPTVKAGVPHVEAPVEILASMVTVRIHLDAMDNKNGPLRVVPGSHLMSSSDRNKEEGISIHCNAGDVFLMRPLLPHSSSQCVADHSGNRRIVHLEYARGPILPDGFDWQTFVPLAPGTTEKWEAKMPSWDHHL